MTTLAFLAHVAGAPHAHAEHVAVIVIIALAILALGLSFRKAA